MMYTLERVDTVNFHGWAIYACDEGFEYLYFSTKDLAEARTVLKELREEGA